MAAQTPLVRRALRRGVRSRRPARGVFQFLHVSHDDVARDRSATAHRLRRVHRSVAGGHAVQRAAAGASSRTGLELGGKDPAYVRADADLDARGREPGRRRLLQLRPVAAAAIERIYVHRDAVRRRSSTASSS